MRKILFFPAFLAVGLRLFAAPAPDFTITDSDGNVRQLYADYVNQGKVVVLDIFFINCPPCNTHAPYWQSLYTNIKAQYPGQVEFLMLSDKSADNNAAVAQYKTTKGLTMPAAGSNGGSLTAVQPYKNNQFGTFYGTPTFIIVEPGTGEVLFDVRGNSAPETMALLNQEIDQLLQPIPHCQIKTYQDDTLRNYALTLSVPGGGTSLTKQITDGGFSLEDFPGLPNVPFFQAVPAKNDNPLNGVSTFDLVQINKQILGIEPFLHPWQFIAGDANGSGTLTTFDIIELRKLILGVYDSLPNINSWVFSPAVDTMSPLDCPVFHAIKIGDVNGNADAAGIAGQSEPRGARRFPILLEDQPVEAGGAYRVCLYAGATGTYQGLQMALRFDPAAMLITGVTSSDRLKGFDTDAWRLSDGRLALSWLGQPVEWAATDPLLTLEIRALRSGRVGEMLALEQTPLHAEAYGADNSIEPLDPYWAPGAKAGVGIWPNPARDQFTVQLKSDRVEETDLQIIDFSGRVLYSRRVSLSGGTDVLEVTTADLPAGMYSLRVGARFVGRLIWQN